MLTNMDNSLENIDSLDNDELLCMLYDIDFDEEKKMIDEINKSSNENDNSYDKCQNCEKENTLCEDFASGIVVCKNCGQVNNYIIDANPEWKSYGDDGKSELGRCSFPSNNLLAGSSIGTSIMGPKRGKLQMLHNWSAVTYRNRSLKLVFKTINIGCEKGGILKCVEDDAKILYKIISECKHTTGPSKGKPIIIRGANRKSLIAACVYFACRRINKTRSPKEIAKLFELQHKDITKGCKRFLQLIKRRNMNIEVKSNLPEYFVPRYCKMLKIKGELVEVATQIAKNARKLNIAPNHTPPSIATASILLMIDMNELTITKRSLSEKFEVSEVTISKAYKTIEQYRLYLINDEAVDTYIDVVEKHRKNLTVPLELESRYYVCKANDDTELNSSDDDSYEIEFDHRYDDIRQYLDDIKINTYIKISKVLDDYNKTIREHTKYIADKEQKRKQKQLMQLEK